MSVNTLIQKPKAIIICGPTGIGKTSTAIAVVKQTGGEIISADSMQIYRRMNIGTAKPTAEEQASVPHHLIDIVDPDQSFDAARFTRLALSKIRQLTRLKVLPFVVGGTGFYIKALVHGLFDALPASPEIRERLRKEADEHESGYLHQRLTDCDPQSATRIHPHDTFRIIRALEVIELMGKPMHECHQGHRFADQPLDALKIGLFMNRESLYERIDRRVDVMIREGLCEEVEELLSMGFSPSLKSMQSIGYRHMVDFLHNRVPWEETVRLLKRDTRRFAKRQMTWFRADPQIRWIEPTDWETLLDTVKGFIDRPLASNQ